MNGFFHVPLVESSRKYTSFLTSSRQFEFLDVLDIPSGVKSCRQLKESLVRALILKLFDSDAITEVHADASKYGYGEILL